MTHLSVLVIVVTAQLGSRKAAEYAYSKQRRFLIMTPTNTALVGMLVSQQSVLGCSETSDRVECLSQDWASRYP